jgi:hypothetical protein
MITGAERPRPRRSLSGPRRTRRPRTRCEPRRPVVDRAANGLCRRLRHRTEAQVPSSRAARGRGARPQGHHRSNRLPLRVPSMHSNCLRGNAGLARQRSALDRPELSCVDDDADRALGLRRQTDTGEPSPPVRPRMRGPTKHSGRSQEFSRDRPRAICSTASRSTMARISPPMRISDESRHLRPLLLG